MSISLRFWGKVDVGGEDDCWPWLAGRSGGRDGESYGAFRLGSLKDGSRRQEYAHRVAFCLSRHIEIGALAAGVVIRHRCDNGLCCNPKHLIDGTQADNVRDKVERGRHLRGEAIKNAILTEHDIPVIRARIERGERHQDIGDDFGVTRVAITNVATRRSWAWV